MFSLGELLLTGVVAIVVLGPKRLPHAAYQLGKALRKVNQLLQPINHAFEQQAKQEELQRNIQRAEAAEKPFANPSKYE